MSRTTATLIVSMVAALGIVARLSMGIVADRFERFEVIVVFLLGLLMTAMGVLLISTAPVAIGIFIVCWVIGSSMGPLVESIVLIKAFGLRHFGSILGAMLPALAQWGIKIDGNAFSIGLQWAAIGIDLPPKPAIRLHIQAADASSAAALGRIVAAIWQRVGQIQSLKQTCPNLDASFAMLSPAVEGNASRFTLDEQQCTRLAADFFAPAGVQVREEFVNIACGTNLSGLGKALLIHANDYNDELPATLVTLKTTAEVTDRSLSCGCDREGKGGTPYVYRGADLDTSANPDMIIVYCSRHHKGGRNVLFLDSHVEWVTEEQFQKLIEKDNLLRRQAHLPEKNAE
jgi:prepilin-type processing-associated H-X9-DG protein